jgi:hypothetical protein
VQHYPAFGSSVHDLKRSPCTLTGQQWSGLHAALSGFRPSYAFFIKGVISRSGAVSCRLDVRRRVMAVIPTTSEARRRDLGAGARDDAIPLPDPSSLPLLGMTRMTTSLFQSLPRVKRGEKSGRGMRDGSLPPRCFATLGRTGLLYDGCRTGIRLLEDLRCDSASVEPRTQRLCANRRRDKSQGPALSSFLFPPCQASISARKPTKLVSSAGPYRIRVETRRLVATLSHEPPRRTRLAPGAGPSGSSVGELA